MPGLSDVSQSLDALERKLRDLERGLGPPPPATGAPPAAPPPGGGGLDELARQIDDLARFREQLQRVGRELEEEYARVLARLGGEAGAPGPEPATAPAEPAPEPPVPAPPPTPAPPEPEPVAATESVVLDAGPFADLAALGAFEQAVAGIGGVAAVDVSGFEGRRAVVEVRLGAPVALLDELRAALPHAFVRAAASPGKLVLDLEAQR